MRFSTVLYFQQVITFRNGIGNPTSTYSKLTLPADTDISVSSVNTSRSISTPDSSLISHFPGRSMLTIDPSLHLVSIFTASRLRILHIVDVDSTVWPLKIFFRSILLINVDFPALVSPRNGTKILYICRFHLRLILLMYPLLRIKRARTQSQV